MANYNKVILVGNLTRDPQLSYLPNQNPVVELGLAVNRRWRDAQGNNKDEACFIDCRAYGKQAETLNQYMTKGQQILIEGRLQFSMWEGKDGTKRSKHRVVVERFQFLGAPGQGQSQGQGQGRPAPSRAAAPPPPQQPQHAPDMGGPQEDMGEPPMMDGGENDPPPPSGEDIPF